MYSGFSAELIKSRRLLFTILSLEKSVLKYNTRIGVLSLTYVYRDKCRVSANDSIRREMEVSVLPSFSQRRLGNGRETRGDFMATIKRENNANLDNR